MPYVPRPFGSSTVGGAVQEDSKSGKLPPPAEGGGAVRVRRELTVAGGEDVTHLLQVRA